MTRMRHTRADRIALDRRIEFVERAAALLRSKEEALDRERVRLAAYADRAGERWVQACAAARDATVRARMLGAGGEIDRLVARHTAAADVTHRWTRSMGIEYPGSVGCEPGPRPDVGSTAALASAIDAARDALAAGADAAATAEAIRRLDLEATSTRRRRRAIEERLMPSLVASRHILDLRLDERDRDQALRVRLAGTQGG